MQSFCIGKKTPYQEMRIYDSKVMGRLMVLDGMVQVAEKVEDEFSEKLMKDVIQRGQEYKEVLIIGGGDLQVVTNLLTKFKDDVHHITVCELDERVVENAKKFFEVNGVIRKAIASKKLTVCFEDGALWVRDAVKANKRFDGIIIDCTEAFGDNSIASTLYTSEFYTNLFRLLNEGGAFSQLVGEGNSQKSFTEIAKESGFGDITFIKNTSLEISRDSPIGVCKKLVC